MITFMDSNEKLMDNSEKCLDSQLWHACAGSMVQMPPVNSSVFYFPQGHAEHASGIVDFRNLPRVPAYIRCRVSGVKFLADPDTDEVFTKIRLVPLNGNEFNFNDDAIVGMNGSNDPNKPTSFAKTLTQSDANNGGGFSVPRYCAETIFPRLDYSADPPVQTILAKDVHGETWKFRHIYRGTPRRHLLTTGWSTFVNHKKLVAGDSIVFLRSENGELCVGIRRAKRGLGGGPETSWNPAGGNYVMPYGGFSAFLRDDENRMMRNGNGNGNGGNSSNGGDGNGNGNVRVRVESVIEAVTQASSGKPFEVVYYPRASTPEFCVKASLVKPAMQIRWCAGMRFKMPFETEDASRISWFMGTISCVQVADPIRWADSPWRLLQVTWDEPDLLQNVKRVSPWLVELVSTMPTIHNSLSPFLPPPRKKMRLLQHPDFPNLDHHQQLPPFCGGTTTTTTTLLESGSHFVGNCFSDNTPAGMQGARHAPYGLSSSDIHLNRLQSSNLFPTCPPPNIINPMINKPSSNSDDVSCLLTMGSSSPTPSQTPSSRKSSSPFLLFGQQILAEPQISLTCSGTGHSISDGSASGSGSAQNQRGPLPERSCSEGLQWHRETDLDTGHCKVFMESEDVGRTLDLSLLGSYEDLYRKLANMFGIEVSELQNHVLYRDVTGTVKQIGDEPFSDFVKNAKRLRIVTDSGSDNVESRF